MAGAKFNLDDLSEAGVKRVSVGTGLARIAYGGLIRAGQEMRDRGTFTFADGAVGFAELQAYF